MKYLVSLIIVGGVLSCGNVQSNRGKLFKGEMFLKLLDFGTEMYTYPLADGTTILDLFENTPESELTDEQLVGKKDYEFLKDHELIGKPHFNFGQRFSNKKFFTVYLSEEEFDKIRDISLRKLRDSGKKVKIQFYGERVNEYILKCYSIKCVKEVRGHQKWEK